MSSPIAAKSDAEGFNASRGPVLHNELTHVLTQMRQLHAKALDIVGEMDAEDIAQLAGYPTTAMFLRESQRLSQRQANNLVNQAQQCHQSLTPTGHTQPAQLPLVREALPEGVLDAEHIDVIAKVMANIPASAPLDARELVESTLVEQARHGDPNDVKHAGKLLLERLDPDGAAPKDDELAQPVNKLRYHRTDTGRMKFTGDIEPEAAELLDAMLSPLAKPQPTSPQIPDERSPGQRLGDAFCEIVHMARDSEKLPAEGGERPNINVTVDYDKLAAGTGQALLELGDRLPASVVRRIACDCKIIPMVLRGESVPMDLGRSRRVV